MRKWKKRAAAAAMVLSAAAMVLSAAGCSGDRNQTAAPGGTDQKTEQESAGSVGAQLQVMASFYTMADFAEKIGGDRVNVVCMVPTGTEPHDWEPSTTDIIGLEQADVFLYNGAGMEHWAEDVAESLENKKLLIVEASEGVELRRETDEHEEEGADEHSGHDHDHGEYDPHVWLDPKNAKLEMENIKNAFVQADPENRAFYEANYEKWAEQADLLDEKYRTALAAFAGKEVVTAHEAYGYLCSAYGLEQLGIDGLSPDSEPDPRRMADIIDFVRKNEIGAVFFEELSGSQTAETVAAETGIRLLALNPLEGLSDKELEAGDDYFSVMQKNLEQLKIGLEGREE